MKKNFFSNISPARDWNILVIIFGLMLLLISIVAWQIYLSNQIGGGYVSSNEPSGQAIVKSIDLNRLDISIGQIEKRNQIFNSILPKGGQIIDPSL